MPKKGQKESNGLEQSFTAAIESVQESPESQASWEHLEKLAETLGKQDDVAKTYLDVLSGNPKPEIRPQLFDAAVGYHDEWFGDDPAAMNRVLSKILEIDPKAHWAFDRLTVVLSAAQQWNELLCAHDQILESVVDPTRRKNLLSEAANVAKDFAQDSQRAIKYMLEHLALDPANENLAASTQRLLERKGSWTDLIDLWRGRIRFVSKKQARILQMQIAECYLDSLDKPELALEELSALLDESPGDLDVCRVLERVLVSQSASDEIKLDALGRLTSNYDSAKEREAAVAAIEKVIGEVSTERKNPLFRDAGMRLATLGKDEEAIGHYASLLVAKPEDLEARKQLRHLAARSKQSGLYANALKTAGDGCQESAQKVALMMEAAHIYWDDQSDKETAIQLYSQVLGTEDVDPTTALSAAHRLNELQNTEEEQEARLEVLEKLAALEKSAEVRKAVLGEAARLATSLDDYEKALEFWQSRIEADESDLEAMSASIEILRENKDWERLVTALVTRANMDILPTQRRNDLKSIAEIQHQQMTDADAAIRTWLGIKEEFGAEKDVLEHLDQLMESQERWSELADIIEVAMGEGHVSAASWLSRLGNIQLEKLNQPTRAARSYIGAVQINPTDAAALGGLKTLSELAETAKDATEALTAAFTATEDSAALVELLELRLKAARDVWTRSRILEETAGFQERVHEDFEAALTSTARAFLCTPENVHLENEIDRLAHKTDLWSVAAKAFLDGSETIDGDPTRSVNLRLKATEILAEKLSDVTAAVAAIESVLESDPNHIHALERLADMERSTDKDTLVATLCRIDSVKTDDLDPLREACERMMESPEAYESKRQLVMQLYQKASRLWASGATPRGNHQADTCTEWAIESCRHLDEDADREEETAELLLSGANLPFDPEMSRDMRLRGARILANCGDRIRAIEIYRSVAAEVPQDIGVLQRLAGLLKQENSQFELLTVLKKELNLTQELDRRLILRLGMARLLQSVEGDNERFQTIAANLEEQPGHEPSIEALDNLLNEQVSYTDAVNLLTDQAQKLEHSGNPKDAAKLWAMVARLKEGHFSDSDGASHAFARVVDLDCTKEALEALARLAIDKNAYLEASTWLEKQLQITSDPTNRIQIMLKLAKAQLQAKKQDEAVETLASAFEEAPRYLEISRLLAMQYRETERWEPLVQTLSEAAMHMEEPGAVLAHVREVQEVCKTQLNQPDLAVPILERANQLIPNDSTLKMALAEGKRITGQLDEARTLADEVIEDFGRRRSAERAATHLLLARIANDQEDEVNALKELETASKMDSQNVEIWQLLAETAKKAGELEKAEQAYRTLLIIIRRTSKTVADQISQSEVLVELSRIAADQDQTEQADELCESAFEVLQTGDREMKRFTEKLLEWDRPDLIARAVEDRLASTVKPREQGAILTDYADLLEERFDKEEEAFEARMRALDFDPGQPAIHDALLGSAVQSDRIEPYLEKLQSLLSNARRGTEAQARCELLLRMCAMMEHKEDWKAAKEYYLEAEATGVREVDVWKTGIKIATAQEDEEEQARILTQLSSLGEDVESETRADVYYRLAEIQLASEDTLTEGIHSMKSALAENPRYARTCRILGRACETHPTAEPLLLLYEQAARRVDDTTILLDAFERRAACDGSTTELVREGVELALDLQENERAEALMIRAIDLSADLLDGTAHVPWALLGLVRLRKESGDFAGAVKWMTEAAAVADPAEVSVLARELTAQMDESTGDLMLSVQLYEGLFDRDPSSREVWEPLSELYTRLGKNDRLERLLEEVQGHLNDPEEQRALRVRQAQLFLNDPERESDALDWLKGILNEDPSNHSALEVLIKHLETKDRVDELGNLLHQRFDVAMAQEDTNAIQVNALALGRFLKRHDEEQAANVFRTALKQIPTDYDLMKNLLACLNTEANPLDRARLLERMIPFESMDNIPAMTLEAGDLYTGLQDTKGALRVLKLGFGKVPDDEPVREQLVAVLRESGDVTGLAKILVNGAENQKSDGPRAAMLAEAAELYLNSLSEPVTAVTILQRVVELDPEKPGYKLILAKALAASGDHEAASVELSTLLSTEVRDELQTEIFKTKASIAVERGDFDQALADLESAFALHPESVAGDLENTLHKQRAQAASNGNLEMERSAVVRLTELMLLRQAEDEAKNILEGWLKKEPTDHEVQRHLLELHTKAERWADVAEMCAGFVQVEEGEAQVEAALQLAHACQQTGNPELARSGLELAFEQQPGNAKIREALYGIYEQAGDSRKLAGLLLNDANSTEDDEAKAELLSKAGLLFAKVDETAEAQTVLSESLELRPKDISTILILVDIYLSSQTPDAAAKHLDMGLAACREQRDPRVSQMQLRMARLAKLQLDAAGEIKWLKQAVLSDRDNGEVAMELVERAEKLEEWDTVVWGLRTIARMKSESPLTKAQIALRQAKISLHQGDERKAALFARQAKQEDPNCAETLQILQELGLD